MSDPRQCDECLAILEEIKAAYAESGVSLKFGPDFWSEHEAFSKMLTGTEDDIDAGFDKYPFRAQKALDRPEYRYPRIAAAFRRMTVHRAHAGHKFPFGK